MEKMVPIETFTSMLAEPSSGSYNTTYFPDGLPGGTGTGAGSSSDAVTHTRPVYCTLWRTVSLAKRSSFCCKSPETLTAPAGPRMSQAGAPHVSRDDLGRETQVVQQVRQLPGRLGVQPLLLHDEALNRDDF